LLGPTPAPLTDPARALLTRQARGARGPRRRALGAALGAALPAVRELPTRTTARGPKRRAVAATKRLQVARTLHVPLAAPRIAPAAPEPIADARLPGPARRPVSAALARATRRLRLVPRVRAGRDRGRQASLGGGPGIGDRVAGLGIRRRRGARNGILDHASGWRRRIRLLCAGLRLGSRGRITCDQEQERKRDRPHHPPIIDQASPQSMEPSPFTLDTVRTAILVFSA
jgi:hypothetical protein